MPGDRVNVITPEGKTISVPSDAIAPLLAGDPRYRLESAGQGAARAYNDAIMEPHRGTLGKVRAGITSTLAGATLGLSDVAIAASEGSDGDTALARRAHPTISTVGEVAGALATALPSGGSSLGAIGARGALSTVARAAPAGLVSRGAAAVAARGAGKSAAKRIAYQAAGGALEGGAQSVGAYVSDVALGGRDLSAEGLMGSFGDGALLGGTLGGALGIGEATLTRARRLFPEAAVTREAAEAGMRDARVSIEGAVRDADDLERAALARIEDRKLAHGADPRVQEHAARIRAEREAREAARRQIAEEQARAAKARADTAEVRLERAKQGPAPRGPRPAKAPSDAAPAPEVTAPASTVSPAPAAEELSDLERALQATSKRLKAGESLADLSAEGRRVATAADDADDVAAAVAAIDPETAKLRKLVSNVRLGRDGVREYLAMVGKRADKIQDRLVATGKLSRDQDVIRSLDGGRDILGAKLGIGGVVDDGPRAISSRLRNPYTDEELIAKLERNPRFVNRAVEASDVPLTERGATSSTARDVLPRDILSGRVRVDDLDIEIPTRKIDPETGEIMPGVAFERRPATGREVYDAIAANRRDPAFDSYLGDDVMRALRGRLDLPDDLDVAIPAITKLEKAEADLVDMLGPAAPVSSQARATALREVEAQHAAAMSLAGAQQAAAVDVAAGRRIAAAASEAKAVDAVAAGLPDAIALPPKGESSASKLADVAAAIEVMSTLGIPGLPNAQSIPFIGPVLGLYLKARAGAAVWRKLGGKLPASVEGKVAGRAAQTRDRVGAAVRAILGTGAKVAGDNAVRTSAAASAILSRSLFSEAKSKPRTDETAAEMWARHRAELAAARRPGAVERALQQRVPTSDPRLASSLAAVARRKLEWLDAQMPRPPAGMPDPDVPPWRPTPAQEQRWARVVRAADDPAGVIERAAAGDVSVDEIETVRAVFPRLYEEAQMAVLNAVADGASIPYARRIQLGALFGLPLTATQDPQFAATMQAGYAAPAEPPPQPRPSANVDLAATAMLQEQNP